MLDIVMVIIILVTALATALVVTLVATQVKQFVLGIIIMLVMLVVLIRQFDQTDFAILVVVVNFEQMDLAGLQVMPITLLQMDFMIQLGHHRMDSKYHRHLVIITIEAIQDSMQPIDY